MPNTYRYPRVIFPGLIAHPLASTFQAPDRSYIVPEGKPCYMPFDMSFYDSTNKWLDLFIAIPPDMGIRLRRFHFWIEPDFMYPRGTKLTFEMLHEDTTFTTPCYVYTGMYYIVPFDVTVLEDTSSGVVIPHNADRQLHESDYAQMYLKLKSGAGADLPPEELPSLYLLAELR